MDTPTSDEPDKIIWLKRLFAIGLAMLLLQTFTVWQVHGVKSAVEQMDQEMPSQSTEVPISVNNVSTTTTVTTTKGEAPWTNETDAEWDARHIATCARIKAAWENVD